MGDFLEIRVIEKIDFEDFEECIDKDYRHYVKLKSREEPYEVSDYTYKKVLEWINEHGAKREKPKTCPYCGSKVLYEVYHNVDGFDMPFMFCNGCKAMFTVEGSEDWVHGDHDGMEELRDAWNRRAE